MTEVTGKRLNKFISESGFCSRREADKLIEEQRVKINGKLPELGTKVMPGDEVQVDGKSIAASPDNKSDRIYIAYNKPIGITCTTERQVKGNIIDAIGHKQRIFPIGRLDKPSEGLIFLTSDGDIVNKILRAENAHDKEYIVTVDKPLSPRFAERMARGVPILGTVTKPCDVTILSKFVFKIVLTQGLNRQIRRMCEYLGYEVTKLKRTRIMSVSLDKLKPGQWRNLTHREMRDINTAVATSSKTAPEGVKSQTAPQSPVTVTKSENRPSARTSDSSASNRRRHSDNRDNKVKPGNKPQAADANRRVEKTSRHQDNANSRRPGKSQSTQDRKPTTQNKPASKTPARTDRAKSRKGTLSLKK
ncbi:23S rRNA pseudouridine(2604) synthase RluF [Thalassotalea mangrovi]|uniref:Pseudouridine synthase n=1 Tax=Thalassotalea mangrovi TaxID=2572245 RepID=A0A4U1B8C9_9GAMM|nr:23S rRNA pseudouridine(2604) synthase RluF [Thalassotalea mangrovi]TKB46275.1 23S rRNA pseudouridine(2604) synthase RluF [Thalassotalea mangrovi]